MDERRKGGRGIDGRSPGATVDKDEQWGQRAVADRDVEVQCPARVSGVDNVRKELHRDVTSHPALAYLS